MSPKDCKSSLLDWWETECDVCAVCFLVGNEDQRCPFLLLSECFLDWIRKSLFLVCSAALSSVDGNSEEEGDVKVENDEDRSLGHFLTASGISLSSSDGIGKAHEISLFSSSLSLGTSSTSTLSSSFLLNDLAEKQSS